MSIDAKTSQLLSTITAEQWEAIFTIAKEKVGQKESDQENQQRNLYVKVTGIMKDIGVPPHIRGYRYLREAVILAYEDESYINSVTKRLYPDVAKKFGTTALRVERAIRYAIEVAYMKGNHEALEKVFEGCYFPSKPKPENAKAIEALVEYLKLHE